jgi:hypothetical protein
VLEIMNELTANLHCIVLAEKRLEGKLDPRQLRKLPKNKTANLELVD